MTVLHTLYLQVLYILYYINIYIYTHCILYSWWCNVLRMQICGNGRSIYSGRRLGENSSRIGLQVVHHITSRLSTSNISAYCLSRRWAAVSRGFCFRCRLVANSADARTLVSLRFLCGSDVLQDDNLRQGWNCGVSWGCQLRSIWANRRCRGRRDLGNLQAEKDWKILEVYWNVLEVLPELASCSCFCWSTSDPVSLPFQGVPLASCLEKCSLHPSCRCRPHKIFKFSFQNFPPHILSPSCVISHQLSPSNFEFLIGQLHFGTGSPVAWDLINASVPGSKSGVKERWQ